jgi:hypothetical protein
MSRRVGRIERSFERLTGAYSGGVSETQVTCDFCGATVDGPEPPLTWSTATDRGRVLRYCERCTRENLRAMESKLDQDFW